MSKATLYELDPVSSEATRAYLAEVDAEGDLLRTTDLQDAPLKRTSYYEALLRQGDRTFRAVLDGGQGYEAWRQTALMARMFASSGPGHT